MVEYKTTDDRKNEGPCGEMPNFLGIGLVLLCERKRRTILQRDLGDSRPVIGAPGFLDCRSKTFAHFRSPALLIGQQQMTREDYS